MRKHALAGSSTNHAELRDVSTGFSTAPPMTPEALSRLYARYAGAFLALTLLSGVWLRAAFVAPSILGGVPFGNALHAHSHLAFFGWTTMALFALLSRRGAVAESAPWLRWHAHLTGAAAGAVFVGFLHGGYNAWTIGLSVVHVLLWLAFATEAWGPLERCGEVERRFLRGSLAFLLLAGAGAMLPGFVMARGIGDPWIGQIAIHSFLTPFMAGWLMLGVMGAIYARVERPRFAAIAYWTTVAGILPAALLHPTAAPPYEWVVPVGRAGTGLLGVGALAFAWDALRARPSLPLLALAAAAAALKGSAEIAVSLGFGLDLIGNRSLGIAYLHLVLLGVVTPVLMALGLSVVRAPWRVALYSTGLAVMIASLASLGFVPAISTLVAIGITPAGLYWSALAGGAACAAAVLLLLPSMGSASSSSAAVRRRRQAASQPATTTSIAIAAKSSAR